MSNFLVIFSELMSKNWGSYGVFSFYCFKMTHAKLTFIFADWAVPCHAWDSPRFGPLFLLFDCPEAVWALFDEILRLSFFRGKRVDEGRGMMGKMGGEVGKGQGHSIKSKMQDTELIIQVKTASKDVISTQSGWLASLANVGPYVVLVKRGMHG